METIVTEQQQAIPVEPPKFNLVLLEGGRNKAANEVHAEFAQATQEAMVDCELMAGFFIIVFDDEGKFSSVAYQGKRTPYSGAMLVDVITDAAKLDLYSKT